MYSHQEIQSQNHISPTSLNSDRKVIKQARRSKLERSESKDAESPLAMTMSPRLLNKHLSTGFSPQMIKVINEDKFEEQRDRRAFFQDRKNPLAQTQ